MGNFAVYFHGDEKIPLGRRQGSGYFQRTPRAPELNWVLKQFKRPYRDRYLRNLWGFFSAPQQARNHSPRPSSMRKLNLILGLILYSLVLKS